MKPSNAAEKIVVTYPFYNPSKPEEGWTKSLNDLMKQDPTVEVRQWGGIELPGGAGRSSFLMSIAGNTAPDVYWCWFHTIKSDIKQGFLYPMNEWLGEDTNGNGQLDPEEAKWDGWAKVPPLWRRVATENGKVYGIPLAGWTYMGLAYRKDLVRSAGLDAENPPATWDEFYYWCQRLTFPNKGIAGASLKRGQRGFALSADMAWFWLPWMQAAGGSPIAQRRVSPTTGKAYDFPMEEESFKAPDTGEDLSRQPTLWRADFSSPAGIAACAYYHKMRWAPWLRDPQTQEPVNLTDEDVRRGEVQVGGRAIRFAPDDVIRGVVRICGVQGSAGGTDQGSMFARGEIAFQQFDMNNVEGVSQSTALPPEMIGLCPIPASDKNHKRVFQGHKHYMSITEGVGRRGKLERDKVWAAIKALTSEAVRDNEIRRRVLRGNAMWCRPDDLKRLGLTDYLNEVPKSIQRLYDEIDNGSILIRTEPFSGFWLSTSDSLVQNVISLTLSENGEKFDYTSALKAVDHEANNGSMFELPRETLDSYRPMARVLFGIGLLVLLVCAYLIIREKRNIPLPLPSHAGGGERSAMRRRHVLPWLMMAPALASILLWSYYPLFRGMVMAFQNYRIVGTSRWVGLDNFIAVAIDANTWIYVAKTFKFVFLTLSIGFLAPILLAFLLTEVPRGKIFFRTLFFLPQLSAGIVVTLLWKIMFDETENGTLNRLLLLWNDCLPSFLSFMKVHTQVWLQDPSLAMLCCVLPGVWAGAGMASLLYIAALHSLPADYYEAAALDGAGFFSRMRHIALPQLLPLIVINFVGAFIGAFQSMGSIFLLTFGGPGKETMVLDLAIWKLAYNDLRFSTATTLAWFLGVGLIGFAYLQIRMLRRVEFRRVEEN